MQDQEWHEFIQDDGSTFPPDHSSIHVMFASGRLVRYSYLFSPYPAGRCHIPGSLFCGSGMAITLHR
jgi:hypothetical protein